MVQFGTDGIRGRYGETLTNSVAYRLGLSLKSVLNTTRLVVGRDTRESGKALLENVIKGATEAGIDVKHAGIVSTPLISHYSKEKNITGIMITASHNPYHDNGLKVFVNGHKCTKEQEDALEAFINGHDTVTALKHGEVYSGEDVLDCYLDLIETMDLYKTDLKIGLDSANGANYLIAEGIFRELSETVKQIGNKPNGKNINDGVGSTHPDALQTLITKNNLDIGFTFDGDGDRVLAVDATGRLYDGDELIYIIATYLKQLGLLHDNTVVLTKMSNIGIIKALNDKGITVKTTDVGDKYVLREMKANNYTVGGENSGHIILRPFLDTGDGLLIALYLLKIVTDQQTTLNALIQDITLWPQTMINILVDDKTVLNHPSVQTAIQTVKETVKDNGKVLVRPSGTEPVIRVTISCETKTEMDAHLHTIVEAIKTVKEAN